MVKRVRGRKRGHHLGVLLEVSERIMSLPQYVWKTALGLCLGWLAATPVHAQSYTPQGAEFAIAGALPGDQIYPAASLNPSGGYLVGRTTLRMAAVRASARCGWMAICPER